MQARLIIDGTAMGLLLAVGGYYMSVEPLLLPRLLGGFLGFVAILLGLTGRDRSLWALLTFGWSSLAFFSFMLDHVLPTWLALPLLAITSALIFSWWMKIYTLPDGLLGLGAGILIAEAAWFLLYWPFDYHSKGLLIAFSGYILWIIAQWSIKTEKLRWPEIFICATLLIGLVLIIVKLAVWRL